MHAFLSLSYSLFFLNFKQQANISHHFAAWISTYPFIQPSILFTMDFVVSKSDAYVSLTSFFFGFCCRIQRENRSSTFRRMGAWVNERFAEEEVVPSNQSATWTWRIRGRNCNGAGPLHGRPGADYQSPDNFTSTWSSASLLPLRRQFTRQLYEWPCLPLFKSRTKLNLY